MATHVRSKLVKVTIPCFRQMVLREYSSRFKRSVQDVHTPENDAEKTRKPRKIINPKQNPFLKFNPDDPVQRGMLHISNTRDRPRKGHQNAKHDPNTEKNRSPFQRESSDGQRNVKSDLNFECSSKKSFSSPPKNEAIQAFTWVDSNDAIIG